MGVKILGETYPIRGLLYHQLAAEFVYKTDDAPAHWLVKDKATASKLFKMVDDRMELRWDMDGNLWIGKADATEGKKRRAKKRRKPATAGRDNLRDRLGIKLAQPRGNFAVDVDPEKWNPTLFVMEVKYNGHRQTVEFQEGGNLIKGRSRSLRHKGATESKGQPFVDHTADFHHIADLKLPKLYNGTLVDGEMVYGSDHRTVRSREGNGKQVLYIFDVLFFHGRDVRGESWTKRREYVEKVVKAAGSPFIQSAQVLNPTVYEFKGIIVAEGFEGGVIKLRSGAYGEDWWKAKPEEKSCPTTALKESESSSNVKNVNPQCLLHSESGTLGNRAASIVNQLFFM